MRVKPGIVEVLLPNDIFVYNRRFVMRVTLFEKDRVQLIVCFRLGASRFTINQMIIRIADFSE